ncbi:hypothetical protein [Micromonospora narathiwatensis]|uniref:Ig-like domain-containing protein n=1 Tax=Micromonospora narathiwatensis TaxID=299146 RepID=A0A1A9AC64_9ACTN|nr:hypothetical protein [Micromonospora narathiwatensis]SBT53719.1 hypothetical protein GA0070621_4922 [Micromonospora narathiwatensis]
MPGQALLRTTVVALTAALAVAGCASGGEKTTESSATTSVTEAPGDATATGSPTPATDGGTTTGTPTGGGSTGGGSTGGGSMGGGTGSNGGQPGGKPTTSAPKAAGPTITFFRVAQKPSCPSGTNLSRTEGTPVVLEWKASNVDSVALSVDGPGVYADNYPPTGSETLNFPCSGAEGDVQRHTYLLTVRNAQGKQTKSLAVTATVHEIKQVT